MRIFRSFKLFTRTCLIFNKPNAMLSKPMYEFSKISKKKQQKLEKTKVKEQAKSKVSNSKQIDLVIMQKTQQNIVKNFKDELSKMKLGRLQPDIFSTIYAKVYGSNTKISQLAQIASKNTNTCILSPYQEQHTESIVKTLQTSEYNFQVTRKDKQITVTQANSSTKQAKDVLIKKVKKVHEDTKEKLRKQRTKCMDELKLFKKFAQEDAVKNAEAQYQKICQKSSKEIESIIKAKEKQLS